MKAFIKYTVIIALSFLAVGCTSAELNSYDTVNNKLVELKHWEYYTGTLPKIPSEENLNVNDLLKSNEWKADTTPEKIPANYKGKDIWIRTELPDWQGTDPAVYIGQVDYSMDIFLNSKLIYELGNFNSSQNNFIGWNQNLVQLPYFKKGDVLTIRLRLGELETGIPGNVLLSSSQTITKRIFVHDINNIIFSVIFFFAGIIVLILYFILHQTKLLLGIALFLIPMGIFIAANTVFFQLLFKNPALFYHLDYISLISATIGFIYSIEQIVADQYMRIVNTIWKIHLAVLIFAILVINFSSITYLDILNYFLILMTINILISLYVIILSAKQNMYESKILIIGIVGFSIFAILENILYLVYGLNSHFGYNVRVLHFGVLLFVGSLLWVAAKNYIDTYKQKEILQRKELESVKRENEARQNFAAKLLESQENERNRIALELHDSIGQKLLLIKNQLLSKIRDEQDKTSTESLKKITDITGETLQEIRSISQNLRPQHLDQLGLTIAIETLIEKIKESSTIKLNCSVDNIDNLIPHEKEINVFRIVQESFNNILKHSKATEASIEIIKSGEIIKMKIKDNGIGMNSSAKNNGGLGVSGMYERARMIGALINIELSKSSGTTINFEYRYK